MNKQQRDHQILFFMKCHLFPLSQIINRFSETVYHKIWPPNLEQMASKCQTSSPNLAISKSYLENEPTSAIRILHTYISAQMAPFLFQGANQHHVIHDLVFSLHPNETGRNKHLLSMTGLWRALCSYDQMAWTSHSIPSVWENNTQQAKEIPPAFDSPFWFLLLNDFCPSFCRRGKKKLFQLDFSTPRWSARKTWLLRLLSGWVMV